MKYNQSLINFMQKCLHYEGVLQSWGITRIRLSEISLSFHVSGFNYSGNIIVIPCKDEKTLILNSNVGYIGSANSAIDAITLLDKYNESNEGRYRGLFNSLIEFL